MQAKQQSARFTVPLLVTALLVAFNFSAAQEVPQSSSQLPVQPQQQSSQGGVTVDPSAGPLKPSGTPTSEAPLPDAPVAPVAPAPAQSQSSLPTAQSPTLEPPLGAAAAEGVKTAGGAASRPAGNAIAPAKQHQYRSLLIKLGAVAAAGIAVGTVYGLSRSTPSTPPHTTVAAAK